MSLLTSAPEGEKLVGWRLITAVAIGFCTLPAIFALALRSVLLADPELDVIWRAALPLITLIGFSPLLTAPFWVVIGLATAFLLRQKAAGSLNFFLSGAMIAALGAKSIGADGQTILMVAILGAAMASFHRFTLAALRPLAF